MRVKIILYFIFLCSLSSGAKKNWIKHNFLGTQEKKKHSVKPPDLATSRSLLGTGQLKAHLSNILINSRETGKDPVLSAFQVVVPQWESTVGFGTVKLLGGLRSGNVHGDILKVIPYR